MLAPAPQPWHCRRPTDPFRGCVGCCVCEERAASACCSGVIVDSGARDRCWRPPHGPHCSDLGPLGPVSTSGPCHWLAWRSPRRGAWHLQAWREGEPCQAQWGGGDGPGLALMEQVSQTKMQEGLGERVGGPVSGINSGSASTASPLSKAEDLIPVTSPRTWEQLRGPVVGLGWPGAAPGKRTWRRVTPGAGCVESCVGRRSPPRARVLPAPLSPGRQRALGSASGGPYPAGHQTRPAVRAWSR